MKTKILASLLFVTTIIIFLGMIQDSRLFIGQVILRDTLSGALKTERIYAQDSLRVDGNGGIYFKEYSKVYSNGNELSLSNPNSITFNLNNNPSGNSNIVFDDTTGISFNKSLVEYLTIEPVWTSSGGTSNGYIQVNVNGETRFIRLYDSQ